ncbi:hypothetical protein NDU88_006566 [Pleurodeles waltl]|uniref:Secreted protein n=1 Tax=Pleurodeles waltl TaxID=8319 RepID=A0AAV7ME96_PLEWA|nr:hypothetical protein NDU88_006566 [Pleurodeles waltl]
MFAPIVPRAPPSCFCLAFSGQAAMCLDSSQDLSRLSHLDCLQFRHVYPQTGSILSAGGTGYVPDDRRPPGAPRYARCSIGLKPHPRYIKRL